MANEMRMNARRVVATQRKHAVMSAKADKALFAERRNVSCVCRELETSAPCGDASSLRSDVEQVQRQLLTRDVFQAFFQYAVSISSLSSGWSDAPSV